MAQYVNNAARVLLLSLLSGMLSAAQADGSLRDPTQPPAALDAVAVSSNTSTAPVQFVSISGARRTAIVHGIPVHIGDRISEGRITGITASGVRIKSDDGSNLIKLFPDVDKQVRASNPTADRGHQR